MDKKAAEEQARQAKEATGRAMFEKGDWKDDIDEDASEEEDDWTSNLEKLRLETEAVRARKEAERLGGGSYANGISQSAEPAMVDVVQEVEPDDTPAEAEAGPS